MMNHTYRNIRRRLSRTLLLTTTITLMSAAQPALASEHADSIIPKHEQEGLHLTLTGPAKSRGVTSIHKRAAVPLANEFPNGAIEYSALRAREITLAPNGQVALHQHQGRPGMAYILSGTIVEYRETEKGIETIEHSAGSIAYEKSGVAHWWHNRSDSDVKALVIDIVPVELTPPHHGKESHGKEKH